MKQYTLKDVDDMFAMLRLAAKDYHEKIKIVYDQLKPEMSHKIQYEYRWINATDFIDIRDGVIEFWENGQCGASDECIHSVDITEELLTEKGRQNIIETWTEKAKDKIQSEDEKNEKDKAAKIIFLRRQLEQLEGNKHEL